MNEILNFLIKAKKSTYANTESIVKAKASRQGSKDYHYQDKIGDKNAIYHDTYFGGEKFIGEEVVYLDSDKPIWGMNYYGFSLDENLTEEAMDSALRPALMKVGEDLTVLPLRGPSKFVNGDYTYTFKCDGTIENFAGVERIYKKGKPIYELHCTGGIIK